MKNKCRVCGSKLYNEPILEYHNMPDRAQFFVDEKDLERDRGIDLILYQCSGCGLLQLDMEAVSYYKDVIRAAGVSQEMKEYRLKHFNKFVDKYELRSKKVIEIGTGCGEFLEIMDQTGVQAFGLEHLNKSVDVCIKKGLNVYKGFIEDEDYTIENKPYDGFFIMNFLEHIPNPNEFLKGIHKNLKEGAVGLIEVPNVDMVLEKLMFSEFIRDHLVYFTKDTLKFLLQRNGFEIIEVEKVWHDYVISMVVRKRSRLNLNKFNDQMNEISNEINLFIDDKLSRKLKVAIWGAGHQSLSVISMTNISDKILFIIDSASFKQGKYTPASHVKVVSPSVLEHENVDVILVMAASYSDEVASIISERHPKILIAILRDYGLEIYGELNKIKRVDYLI